jgi:hypothetical protein
MMLDQVIEPGNHAQALHGMLGYAVGCGNWCFSGFAVIGFPGSYAIVSARSHRFGVDVPNAHRSVGRFAGMFRVHEVDPCP